jgi:hypothetical protein
MTVRDGTTPVTRRQLYATVAPVWIFLVIVIADSMRSGVRWPEAVLLAAALVSMVWYFRMAYPGAA